ncbi:MAG: PAS domain S-box protein [Candidatus Aminicenantes bacterium]|nr:PAS domain S-box protein [Candidatus Aminicenantes bacterium]
MTQASFMSSRKERFPLVVLILVFIALASGIIAAGILYYRNYKQHYRLEVERQLSAIAELKVGELTQWRKERLGDAAVFYKNVEFSALVRRHFEQPENQETQKQLRTWLGHIQAAAQYDRVMLLDPLYSKKMIIPDGPERSTSFVSSSSSEGLRSGKVVFEDFYWNEQNQRIYLKVLVPILDEARDARVIGILALRVDPETYLYPFISRWPTPNRTAETLLIRREENDALYLNELKFQKNAALHLRIPLRNKDVSAVKAVLGQEGIMEGVDYRGVPVIADLRPIPDSPWFLVAKMDSSEVFGPLKTRLREIVVLVAILLLGMGAAVGYFWRRQSARFYRDRNQATEALRESEGRYEALFAGAGEGILVADLKTKQFSHANPALCRMFGYTKEEFMRLGVADIHPKESLDHVLSEFEAQARGDKTLARDLPCLRKDGTLFHVDISASLIVLDGRECNVGFFVDVTGRKRAEEKLRESEERWKLIFDYAPDAYYLSNLKGKLIDGNKEAEKILGYKKEELIGKNFLALKLVSPRQIPKAAALLIKNTLGKSTGPDEFVLNRKDGSQVMVEIRTYPIKVKDHRIVLGIARDITERKQAEENLKRAMEKLEQTNVQLEASIKRADQMTFEAQAANVAKSQFLANMSHEIRTPMNGVIGMTGLLLATDLSEEQRRYAETARSSGEALLSVINDILDFSKIEAEKLELEELDFDIRATLEDVAELLAFRAHEKHLEFICRIAPEVQTFVRGDPGRLRQILINLGNNAIKFTSRGEVAIHVRMESETDGQIKIRFEVKDTGIGIPQDRIGLLFTAFQQVDASTTRRFGGTGLGLAISKRLAERMGGEIGIDSVEGRGSTFWFTAVFGKQPRRKRLDGPPPVDLRGVRILVVDDNATNRQVLAEQLESWGVRHAETESAAGAVDMLRAARAEGDPFRIAITDMQMPEMDGESLGRAIKADPAFGDTHLVMMSSLGKRGDAKRLKDIGFSAYLTKPVKQSQLYDCLAMVLGGGAEPDKTPDTALVTRHTLHEARRRNVRILLAEDNPTNQQVAQSILEKLGFGADVVPNGRKAIQALETIRYDIVLMDVQMPEMDGFEATRAIRSGKTGVPNPGIPIIAMTAHAMKGDRELCLQAGMDDYITKPIAPQALAEALEKWMDKAQEQQLKAPAPGGETDPSASPPVFDRQALSARLMGDEDLLREIIAVFLEDMPKQLQALKKHIDQLDAGSAGNQAHTIKGSAANVGGMALSAAAGEMEKAGKTGRPEEIAALMPELERQFNLLRTKMREGKP